MAQNEDFTIDQGSDVAIELYLVDRNNVKKDLTGHSIAAKMKRTYTSDSSETYAFTTAIGSPPTDGVVTIGFTNIETDTMKAGRYVYDVELSHLDSASNTIIERILEGKIEVKPSVTK